MGEMDQYLSGKLLYGDDFTLEQINAWYEDEKEAYANLGANDSAKYFYEYQALDKIYFLNYLPKNIELTNVLGIGSAYGHEFLPLIDQIKNLYIIEPSDQLVSEKLGTVIPKYSKPNINGKLDFEDNMFDMITCFSVLHHIPNVSFVLSEVYRCLKPGGYLLLREPINSMGNWNEPRPGLTKRERGIPLQIFDQVIGDLKFDVINKKLGFCMTYFFQRRFQFLFKKPIYSYSLYLKFDSILSSIFSKNIVYHPKNKLQRIGPSYVYYLLRK